MSLVAAWLAFPAILLALATGWGLLLRGARRAVAAGRAAAGGGLRALVVVLQVPASGGGIARLATPLAVAGAVAGMALRAGQTTREGPNRPSGW